MRHIQVQNDQQLRSEQAVTDAPQRVLHTCFGSSLSFKGAGWGGWFPKKSSENSKKEAAAFFTEPLPTSCVFIVLFHFVLRYVLVDLCSAKRSSFSRLLLLLWFHLPWRWWGAELPPGLWAVPGGGGGTRRAVTAGAERPGGRAGAGPARRLPRKAGLLF